MTQNYQNAGKPSEALETLADQKFGWQGYQAEPPEEIRTDPDQVSAYNIKANRQAIGLVIPTMAGYQQTPMAEEQVEPIVQPITVSDQN